MNKRDIKENQKLGSPVNKSVHRPEPTVLGPESSVQHLRLESRNALHKPYQNNFQVDLYRIFQFKGIWLSIDKEPII